METWRFEGRDAAHHETMFFLLLYGPGIAFICQVWSRREEFTTGCCRTSLLSASCFRMNLRAVMSIGCCTSCSGCTCDQSHGSSPLRPCCSRCRAPKSCNDIQEAWLLLQSLDPTSPSDVSCQELSSSILDKCICYVPPYQKSIPCASCVHS